MGVRILPLPKQLSSCLEIADAEDRVNAPTASAQTATAMTAPRSKDTLTLNRPPAQSLKPPISMDSAASRTPRKMKERLGSTRLQQAHRKIVSNNSIVAI